MKLKASVSSGLENIKSLTNKEPFANYHIRLLLIHGNRKAFIPT